MRFPVAVSCSLVGMTCLFGLMGVAQAASRADAGSPMQLPPLPAMPMQIANAGVDNPSAEESFKESPKALPAEKDSTPSEKQGEIQVQAQDPVTGEIINIDINSDSLSYDPSTDLYTVTGNVYIIIPEKKLEILADEVTFNSKSSNMVAVGNVFIMSDKKVIGSDQTQFDMENNISRHQQFRTITDNMRIQSKTAERAETYSILKDGRMILAPEVVNTFSSRYRKRGLRFGQGAIYSYFSASRSSVFLQGDLGKVLTEGDNNVYNLDDTVLQGDKNPVGKVFHKPISPRDVATANFTGEEQSYHLKVKRIDIHRLPGNYNEIELKQGIVRYKKIPILFTPTVELGYQEDKKFLTYLGPELGYNVDYGGMFWGPGWDHRFYKGWLRFSPIISYGGGRRLRANVGEPNYVDPQFGYGILAHYRAPDNHADFGYSSTLREPIFLMDQQLFGRNQTRLRLGVNQYYNNGFFGFERPRMIGEVTDLSQFQPSNNWVLRTFASAGVAKDDFYPTRDSSFFVKPKSAEPIITSRIQLQGQLRSTQPLLYLGKYAAMGAIAQGRVSLYGTGDTYGILQGGPFLNVVGGPVFTQVRYLYGQVMGHSPFVFDTYYRGRNYVQGVNSIDIGKYLTVGATHGLNLNRDNAKNSLLVDQKFFFSAGSKNVKFSMAYDMIQKRSYFGLTLNPDGGQLIMDFDAMNIYQPNYDASTHMPQSSVVAPRKKQG